MKIPTVVLSLAASAAMMAASAPAADMQDGRCGGAADENFICGPVNAEDLLRIPGTDWVLASRMAGPGVTGGAIYLMNVKDHSWGSLDLDAGSEARDTALYPDCPGRPTAAAFSGHGMALDKSGDVLKLLAINHGGRESVEVFDLTAIGVDEPSLTWIGCVVAPENAQLNSVVGLPKNGMAVTKFFDASSKSWAADLFAGKPTGNVLEWSPDGGWMEVEGTALSGPNGLAIAPDASAYFVAEWGNRKLHKIARGPTPAKHEAIDAGVLADNVHWDEDGKLLLTGQDVADKQEYAACALSDAEVCPDPFKVLRVDPDTMAAEELVSRPGTKEFGSGTTALDLGSEYWIGTSRGNRIARFAKP